MVAMADFLISLIESIGYFGVGTLMFLEAFIPVVQSEIIMPFSGFTARVSNEFLIYFVVLSGVIGSQLGSLFVYTLASKLPRKKVFKIAGLYGKYVGLPKSKVKSLNEKFIVHSRKTVLIGRFIPGFRSFVAVPAGMNHMPVTHFFIYNLVGTVFWVTLLAYAGYLLGGSYHLISDYSSYITYFLLVLALIYLTHGFYRYRNN